MNAKWCVPLLFALLVVGCSKGPDTKADDPNAGAKLKELKRDDVKVGTGATAEKGDLVLVTYTGTLLNGREFDSNDKPEAAPLAFRLGAGGMIPGWEKGLPGMRVGGECKLSVPAALGYGAMGSGDRIPPNTDIYFKIKLLDVVKMGDETLMDINDITVGTGPVAQKGDTVKIKYLAKFVNGFQFDPGEKGKTRELEVPLNSDEIQVPGLITGINGMKVGGKRLLRCPPKVAFDQGYEGVPADQVILFEVELIGVKKKS